MGGTGMSNFVVGLIDVTRAPHFQPIKEWPTSSYMLKTEATAYCPKGHVMFVPFAQSSNKHGPWTLVSSPTLCSRCCIWCLCVCAFANVCLPRPARARLNVTTGEIISNVTLPRSSTALQYIHWDYDTSTLYAALARSNATDSIVTVSLTTGRFSSPIGTGPRPRYDSWPETTIDVPNHTIFTISKLPTNGDFGIWAFDYMHSTCLQQQYSMLLRDGTANNASVETYAYQDLSNPNGTATLPGTVFTWNY